MKGKVIVISLGGSLIIPKEIDYYFLKNFRKIIRKNYRRYKFVVVCGGGFIARKYISVLKKEGKSVKQQALAGIRATRMNALFLIQLFGNEANSMLPKSIKEVKSNLIRNNIVFCGALRYGENETSDGTAAKLAQYFKTDLINMSNVSGLYTSNPLKNKKANFIPKISWEKFKKMALKIKYRPGQHFVLDQHAAQVIKKYRIKTCLIGGSAKNLYNLLNGKKFIGTVIEG